MRILLIEDDPVQAEVVNRLLASEGFTVDHLVHGEDGILAAEAVGYEAIILDLVLPDIDGIDVLRRLREARMRAPVLILSSRAAVASRIDGLDSGADDFLPKPFDLDELVARLRALLRRPLVGDRPLALPRLQLRILELLMRRPGRIVSKALFDTVLYEGADGNDTTARIHFHISQLRKRLRTAGAGVHIETHPGVGYALMGGTAAITPV